MSCQYANGYATYLDNLVQTTNVSLSAQSIVLELDSTTIGNGDVLCIQIAQAIPSISELTYIPKVIIQVDGLGFFDVVQDVSFGLYGSVNYFYADQLVRCPISSNGFKSNQILSVKYGSDTQIFNYVGTRRPLPESKALTIDAGTTTSTASFASIVEDVAISSIVE